MITEGCDLITLLAALSLGVREPCATPVCARWRSNLRIGSAACATLRSRYKVLAC
jgi:hypothetical protein